MKNSICPLPFSTFEPGQSAFVPCCRSWLTDEYLTMKDQSSDKWNGKTAQLLRKSILDGSYSYCQLDRCTAKKFSKFELTLENMNANGIFVSDPNLAELLLGNTKMPSFPSELSISLDPRCNLACPSCRSDHQFILTNETEFLIVAFDKYLKLVAPQLESLLLAGNGEVFFSPWMRSLLKNVSPEKYPKLKKLFLRTNGILMDEAAFVQLRPGANSITHVSVSIDAATEETYQKVRGGDWKKLMQNLAWLSDLRSSLGIQYFEISFVVSSLNFLEMQRFVDLGAQFNVDQVIFTPISQWKGAATNADFESLAIHLESHQNHLQFKTELMAVKKSHSSLVQY